MSCRIFPEAIPPHPRSSFIRSATPSPWRLHQGHGDMWPLTWGQDDNIYAGAGDNNDSPMNFWKVTGSPVFPIDGSEASDTEGWELSLVDNLPLDPAVYCTHSLVHKTLGLKPAGLLDIGGTLYFAVEAHNYGTDPDYSPLENFLRQANIHGWIITSLDYGKTWNREATPVDFFTGRLASCHFLQFGRGYEGSRDNYVYAYFPSADDGLSYWENGDYILLGRVPKERILDRNAWEFCTKVGEGNVPTWSSDDAAANPIFRYDKMTGENHVSYNPGIGRYLMGNYGFVDPELRPRPYHDPMTFPDSAHRSQLTLFEAPEPWGPWSLFYQDDNWGTVGDYQPNFPPKWMSNDGKTVTMVCSGSEADYSFTVQPFTLEL